LDEVKSLVNGLSKNREAKSRRQLYSSHLAETAHKKREGLGPPCGSGISAASTLYPVVFCNSERYERPEADEMVVLVVAEVEAVVGEL
jgi:hypothetical protein